MSQSQREGGVAARALGGRCLTAAPSPAAGRRHSGRDSAWLCLSPVFSIGEDVGVLSGEGYKHPQWWGLVGSWLSLSSQWGKIWPRGSHSAPLCSWQKDRVTQTKCLLCFFTWLSLVFELHRVSSASLWYPRTIFIGLFIVFVVFCMCVGNEHWYLLNLQLAEVTLDCHTHPQTYTFAEILLYLHRLYR